MTVHDWSRIPIEPLSAGLSRQCIHTSRLTVARISLAAGSAVPEHRHENEQLSTIERGALRFVVAGQEVVVRAGEALEIPPNVPHSAVALEDTVAVDVFSPLRQDWIRGDDAYLRGGSTRT
jgi:quercetin dioxygenase-like cupin family protein